MSLVLHLRPLLVFLLLSVRTWGPSTDGGICEGCFLHELLPSQPLSAAVGSFCPRDGGGRRLGCAGHLLQGPQPRSLLMSGLLFFQMGFFKRARYPEATVPQYHAVKIPREDRQQFKEEKTGTILRNNWGGPRDGGPDAHPILAADGHLEPGSDGHPVPGTA